MAKVLNKHKDVIPDDAVYIGRPSKWGNPYVIGKDGTREEVIKKYALYAGGHFGMGELAELYGKDLVCFCSPQPCHGDVLIDMSQMAINFMELAEKVKRGLNG